MAALLLLCLIFSEKLAHTAVSMKTSSPSKSGSWICHNERCVHLSVTYSSGELWDSPIMPYAVCRLTCGNSSTIWPKPTTDPVLSRDVVPIRANQFFFSIVDCEENEAKNGYGIAMLKNTTYIVLNDIRSMELKELNNTNCEGPQTGAHQWVSVKIKLVNMEYSPLTMQTDETYKLSITTEGTAHTVVRVNAPSFFGARHALETMKQLMVWDEMKCSLVLIKEATIVDGPTYPHRGVMIDTGRNYIEIPRIKKIIDGLSYNKMTVLHWRLTSPHSFPFVPKRLQHMPYNGAFSAEKVYKPNDIKDIVEYAELRGVKIFPELGVPGNVGAGWNWKMLLESDEILLCYEKEPYEDYCFEPPCGILNPVNEETYVTIGLILREMKDTFKNVFRHMGGQNIKPKCWNEHNTTVAFMRERGWSLSDGYLKLWEYFDKKILQLVQESHYGVQTDLILWASNRAVNGEVPGHLSPFRYIIQFWSDDELDESTEAFIRKKYRLIMTTSTESDRVTKWQQIYVNSPRQVVDGLSNFSYDKKQFLGGEILISKGDVPNYEEWSQIAALAERFWTDQRDNKTNLDEVELRLNAQCDRLSEIDYLSEENVMKNQNLRILVMCWLFLMSLVLWIVRVKLLKRTFFARRMMFYRSLLTCIVFCFSLHLFLPWEDLVSQNPHDATTTIASPQTARRATMFSPFSIERYIQHQVKRLGLDDFEDLPRNNIDITGELIFNDYSSLLRYTISPQNACRGHTKIDLIIFIISASAKADRRQSIRLTWLKLLKQHRKRTTHAFIIGRGENKTMEGIIQNERDQYDDIIQINATENYNNLILKTMSMLHWTNESCPRAKYILKVDDDVYVNVDNVFRVMNEVDSSSPGPSIYGTEALKDNLPVRNPGKNFMSLELWPWPRFPRWVTGGCYMITQSAIKPLLVASQYILPFPNEDVFLSGLCARKAKVQLWSNKNMLRYFGPSGLHVCQIDDYVALTHARTVAEYHEVKMMTYNTTMKACLEEVNKDTDLARAFISQQVRQFKFERIF